MLSLFVLGSGYSFGQEIDQRLLLNQPEKAQRYFKTNKFNYNYMLFELDSAYVVVNETSLTKDQRRNLREDVEFTPEVLKSVGTSSFNYWTLGLRLQSVERQYIRIDQNRILVLKSTREITEAFRNSPFFAK